MGKKIARVVDEQEEVDEQPYFLSAFFKNLKDIIITNLMGNIKESIKEKLQKIETKVVRNITSYILLFLGVISLSLAFIFFIDYYFGLNLFWGFLICGLLFILISLIFRWLANKN